MSDQSLKKKTIKVKEYIEIFLLLSSVIMMFLANQLVAKSNKLIEKQNYIIKEQTKLLAEQNHLINIQTKQAETANSLMAAQNTWIKGQFETANKSFELSSKTDKHSRKEKDLTNCIGIEKKIEEIGAVNVIIYIKNKILQGYKPIYLKNKYVRARLNAKYSIEGKNNELLDQIDTPNDEYRYDMPSHIYHQVNAISFNDGYYYIIENGHETIEYWLNMKCHMQKI